MAALAVEHMRSTDDGSTTVSSPSRRSTKKLVLPNLTQAMQQDLALSKGASGSKASKPLSICTRPEFAEYQLQGIVTPHPNDVLCGRGGGSNNHPGNESFRELVNEVKFPYVNCPKREKPLIARRIVEAVRNQTPPGRFLSKDSKTGLWNDIGDGKAREKTSQALREGAPVIREMNKERVTPTNVAAVLKEAKKAERAEKEYGMKLPHKRSKGEANSQNGSDTDTEANNDHDMSPHQEPTVLGRAKSMGISSPNASMPPLKKFCSYGEHQQATVASPKPNVQQSPSGPAAWHTNIPQQQLPGRNFNMNMMTYPGQHQMMGGFASPYGNGMQARYQFESVPVETVRRLLLGQLDPVQLALQILQPEEAAIVAHRHGMMGTSIRGSVQTQPLSLAPMVSDGSSTSSSLDCSQTAMKRANSDQSTNMAQQGGATGDDGSSVGSKQSNTSGRALPKKKRKFQPEIHL